MSSSHDRRAERRASRSSASSSTRIIKRYQTELARTGENKEGLKGKRVVVCVRALGRIVSSLSRRWSPSHLTPPPTPTAREISRWNRLNCVAPNLAWHEPGESSDGRR